MNPQTASKDPNKLDENELDHLSLITACHELVKPHLKKDIFIHIYVYRYIYTYIYIQTVFIKYSVYILNI